MLLLGVLVVIAAWLVLNTFRDRSPTISDARKIVAAIPLGSTRGEVEKRLDEYGIRHDYFEGVVADRESTRTIASIARVDPGQISGTVRATIDRANVDLFFTGEIRIYFFLDKNGKLVRSFTYPIVHNP
ncbi:MAG TPA: hypothetical protein VFE78_05095 [Gemmataceae bacterium]|jgi:hypothetical protein|nr:hypothetical protein [Gemmataceae bacterium]